MLILRWTAWVSIMVVALAAGWVSAQEYPNKPIRMVAGPAASGSDFQARTIAQGITGPLGQPVVIDNRPNNLVGDVGSRMPPDGYGIALVSGSFWHLPYLQDATYDPVRDFAPITLIEKSPTFLVVHPSLPVKSVKELIALAKAKPGQLNYSFASIDTRLAGELFKSMAGINFVLVAYSTGTLSYSDLLGGQVQMTFGSNLNVMPHVKSGKLRALAVTTIEPLPEYPDLPAVSATVPGFEKAAVGAIFAPAKTPPAIITRLNQEIVRFLKTPEAKQRFASAGSDAVTSSPEELAAYMKADMARMSKVIKDAGIRAN